MALSETPSLLGCSDFVICGKSVHHIQNETGNDYLDKTVTIGETLAETETRRKALLDGMTTGTFHLMPERVSQATTTSLSLKISR